MKRSLVVFAGFSLPKYVEEARSLFPKEEYELTCVYGREVTEQRSETFLPLFDRTYHRDSLPLELPGSDISLVTCTQERDMETYIELLRDLKMITNKQSDLWKKAINKRTFKETVRGIRPDLVPKVTLFDRTASEIAYPAVIKPTNMTGSSFVAVIRNEDEKRAYLRKLSEYDLTITKLNRKPELVVEEFVPGPQYSMNIYVDDDGRVVFCPLIRVMPAFELGHDDTYSAIQYTTEEMGETELNSLKAAITDLVEIFKIKNTSAHFDCILSPTGWKMCEMGLRIGGNRQELFSISHGFSHFRNDLKNRVGRSPKMGPRIATSAIVQKAPDQEGSLVKIDYEEPRTDGMNFQLDKLKVPDPKAGPVSRGRVTAFRAFLSGNNEKATVAAAKELFESVSFDFNDQTL